MRDLAELLPLGVASRVDLTLATSTTSVTRWTSSGQLLHVHPGVVMLPSAVDDPHARARAATLWARGPLSHCSALMLWGVAPLIDDPLHVTVSADRSPRRTTGVVVHRTTVPLSIAHIDGIPLTSLARSLVDTWDLAHRARKGRLPGGLARRAVIESVRTRRVRVASLRSESAARGIFAGSAALGRLLDLVAGGCESELEIWGVKRVLPGPPTLPRPVQQHAVRLGSGRWIRLDAAYPDALVAVELDGAAFHGSREARERDLRRDSALAALGWAVLRFSYARLMAEPEGCRREIETVVRARLATC
ncbi:MAG: hypothetical protein AVDCRST_MAG52-209 [uncultured Blastococcus sp.]|uniref:Restriction endonuclease type II-like domain-containing protein n=1 Tax=uncultured Blastococcus sp. TaxID=217144 RepID=A0A6J4H5Q0_9ACTN|nr:MAG: hypothetical protein AVDCRST_MAG52-209 [uncultured Blastococcus sp.]